MNRKMLVSGSVSGLLILSALFFGFGCFEMNAVNAMFFQSIGVIGLLVVLQLKGR